MKLSLFFILSLLIIMSTFDTISQLILKTAINSISLNINTIKKIFIFILRLALIPWVWTALIFSCLSLFIWLFVLSKVDLNFAFSIDSMHYIFIGFASKFLLKEKVGIKRWLGTIFIVIGIILVGLS